MYTPRAGYIVRLNNIREKQPHKVGGLALFDSFPTIWRHSARTSSLPCSLILYFLQAHTPSYPTTSTFELFVFTLCARAVLFCLQYHRNPSIFADESRKCRDIKQTCWLRSSTSPSSLNEQSLMRFFPAFAKKRMSTSHDISEASKTSSRRPSQDADPESAAVPQSRHLTIQELISQSERLRESPEEIQRWFENLNPKAAGSKVPAEVVALSGTTSYNGRPCTFVEVLADWLMLWQNSFSKSRKKSERLYEKATPSQLSKESRLLVWLLEFINDYLRLKKSSLSPSDVESITAAAIEMCSKTFYHSDIAAAIPVLSTIAEDLDFPVSHVEDTMTILASSLIHVIEASDAIHECCRLLVAKGLGMQELFRFTGIPKKNDNRGLVCARGSLRLLSHLIETSNSQGDYVIDLAVFIETLSLASKQQLFRYAPDIINACHAILASSRQPELTTTEIEQLLDIAARCLATAPGKGDASSAPLSLISSTQSDPERILERHHGELRSSAIALGADLYSLSSKIPRSRTIAMADYVLEYPLYSPKEHVVQCLKEGLEAHLFVPSTSHWKDRCIWLQEKYLSDDELSAECRIHAIHAIYWMLSTAKAKWLNDPTQADDANSPMKWFCFELVETLLQSAPFEEDLRVMEALYDLLSDLTGRLPDSEKGYELAIEVIQNLRDLIKDDSRPRKPSRAGMVAASIALVQVFRKNFHAHPLRAGAAFEPLLWVASMNCSITECRLEAMRCLFRIRSTNNGQVYLTALTESAYIARALCKTQESAKEYGFELPATQRKSASSTNVSDKSSSSYESLWMYDDAEVSNVNPLSPSPLVTVLETGTEQPDGNISLKIALWLVQVISCLQSDKDWETYSFCLVNAGSQLSNISLFRGCLLEIATLRRIVCEQVVRATVREPPAATGLKKSDVASCLYNILTPLIAYATMSGDVIQKEYGDDLVRAFLHGVGGRNFEGTDRGCIHALSVCALEIPRSVASQYPNILERISTSITKSYLTLHILEFLSQVANLPEIHSNFLEEEIRQIFAMCILFLEKAREPNITSPPSLPTRTATPSRSSGVPVKRPPYRAEVMKDSGEPKYASALAYHTMICWFLSMKLERRKDFVSWLIPRLTFKSSVGKEIVDEQSEVLIDMMQRTAFSDLGETAPNPNFAKPSDGHVNSTSWLVGYSIITAETAGRTGLTQITKRQASGTTYSLYQQSTTPLPPHHAPSQTAIRVGDAGPNDIVEMLPPHILLQMITTAAPTSVGDQPVALPQEEFVVRAINLFDTTSTVDSYKAGVLFVGPGKTHESEFLMLQSGSADYKRFLDGLGFEVSLEPPLRFKPHGLSCPRDGKSTIAWRDRVTEVVCLVATMMPANDDEEPEWVTKKAHIGNCHVNIIFNRSGEAWHFDNLRTQFSSVNIVITPADLNEHRDGNEAENMSDFYRVDVVTKEAFPNISPAADPKIVSAAQLPRFVRILALNANVFSEVWKTKDHDSEFPSTWRGRLQAIKRLKGQVEAHTAKVAGKKREQENTKKDQLHARGGRQDTPGGEGRMTPIPQDDVEETLAKQLDFGRWTS